MCFNKYNIPFQNFLPIIWQDPTPFPEITVIPKSLNLDL